MKTTKVSLQLKCVIASLAIATGVTSWQPVSAQNFAENLPKIGWNSKLSTMGIDKLENIGKTYEFYCQTAAEDLIHPAVWGTDFYTLDSGICSTAVHAGMITEKGGAISIELLKGQEFYTGSKQNKVKSDDRGTTALSYTFKGEPVVNQQIEQTERNRMQQKNPSIIERVVVESLGQGLERAFTGIFKINKN